MSELTDKIDIGIIAAPRELPTLAYSVKSLQRVLPDAHLHIFHEPGRIELDCRNVTVKVNPERLGALKNFNNALQWLLYHRKKPFIWITEDDYDYNRTLVDRLTEATNDTKEYGYYNMFTNYWNPALPNPMPEGWTNLALGFFTAWGMSYLFPRAVALRMAEHEAYKEYVATKTKTIDGVVSDVLLKMKLPMYFHNPSPSCSCSSLSTLGHQHHTDGLHYVHDNKL